jgi:hypothetical protein
MLRALSRLPFSLPVSIMSKTAARTITTLPAINITFLGTASAQPSSTRNHSSLALSIASDLWLFDCGEATQHQLQRSSLRSGKIKKVFITHTHGARMACRLPDSLPDHYWRRPHLRTHRTTSYSIEWRGRNDARDGRSPSELGPCCSHRGEHRVYHVVVSIRLCPPGVRDIRSFGHPRIRSRWSDIHAHPSQRRICCA